MEHINQLYVGVGVEPKAFEVVDRRIQLLDIVQDLSNPVTFGDKIMQVLFFIFFIGQKYMLRHRM